MSIFSVSVLNLRRAHIVSATKFWSHFWLQWRFQDEPLTIRTDIVKRGSQRKQFDCEPFLEVGNVLHLLDHGHGWDTPEFLEGQSPGHETFGNRESLPRPLGLPILG